MNRIFVVFPEGTMILTVANILHKKSKDSHSLDQKPCLVTLVSHCI